MVGLVVVAGSSSSSSASGGGEQREAPPPTSTSPSGSTNGVQPDDRDRADAAAGQGRQPASRRRSRPAATLRLHLQDEGHEHIPPGCADARTTRPTRRPPGNHVEPPYQQADGAYSEMPEEIDFVHSLEHGRLEIQYAPDLPENDQLELKGLYDTMYGATLLFPNENMPYEVAATTWTNLLGCPEVQGRDRRSTRSAPSARRPGASTAASRSTAFAFTGPTPANPSRRRP